VDTGLAQFTDKVLAAIRQLAGDKPIRVIINTNARDDHAGGNERLGKSGSKIGGGLVVGGRAPEGAMVIGHEHVLELLPQAARPTDAYPGESKEAYVNGEALEIVHPANAATAGDSIVHFRRSDVVVAGDVFSMTSYPVIDVKNGGSFEGVLAAVNRIIDITIPKDWQEGGTMVIPGHGRLTDEADVVEYRDMLTIIRDRIQDLVRKGMTLEQVKAARPTRDYDGRYGSPVALIETAYAEMITRTK
jgi:glyoxylase-like metal-dependent hydrolase (beta-lactamase superfamily II)